MKISDVEAILANTKLLYGDIDVEMWGCIEVDEDGNGADTSAPEFSVLVRNVGSSNESKPVLMVE